QRLVLFFGGQAAGLRLVLGVRAGIGRGGAGRGVSGGMFTGGVRGGRVTTRARGCAVLTGRPGSSPGVCRGIGGTGTRGRVVRGAAGGLTVARTGGRGSGIEGGRRRRGFVRRRV